MSFMPSNNQQSSSKKPRKRNNSLQRLTSVLLTYPTRFATMRLAFLIPVLAATGLLGQSEIPPGHSDYINTIRYDADSSHAVTTSAFTARAWDAATGKQLGVYRSSGGWLGNSSLSGDGKLAATLNDFTGKLDVWSVETGAVVQHFQVSDTWLDFGDDCHFSSDGRFLIVFVDVDTKVNCTVFDVVSGNILLQRMLPNWTAIIPEVFTANADYIVLPDESGQAVEVLSLPDLTLKHRLEPPSVYDGEIDLDLVGFTPDDRSFFAMTESVEFFKWSLESGLMESYDQFAADSMFAYGMRDNLAYETAAFESTLHAADLMAVDGNRAAVALDSVFLVVDVLSGQIHHRIPFDTPFPPPVHFAPNGGDLVVGSIEKSGKMWQLHTGEWVPWNALAYPPQIIPSPTGERFLSIDKKRVPFDESSDTTVDEAFLRDAETNGIIRKLGPDECEPSAAVFSPSGGVCAVVAADSDWIEAFDSDGGESLWKVQGKHTRPYLLAADPTGRALAIGHLHGFSLLDASTGSETLLKRDPLAISDALYFGASGNWFITEGMDGLLRFWSTASGKLLMSMSWDDAFNLHAYDSLGRRIQPPFDTLLEGR